MFLSIIPLAFHIKVLAVAVQLNSAISLMEILTDCGGIMMMSV